MAKSKYTVTNTVDIVGTLDYNQSDELVVIVGTSKGDNLVAMEVPLKEILERCVGMQITPKLTNEENKCDG